MRGKARQGFKQPTFFRFGVERRCKLNLRENQREFGHELDEFGGKRAEQVFDFRGIAPGKQIAQRINPQRVRKRFVLLKTLPLQHDEVLVHGTLAKLVEQAALAHARLAGNPDAMAFTPLCIMQSLPKNMEFGLTANDDGRDDLGGVGRHVRHLILNTERLSNENVSLVASGNASWHSAAVPPK